MGSAGRPGTRCAVRPHGFWSRRSRTPAARRTVPGPTGGESRDPRQRPVADGRHLLPVAAAGCGTLRGRRDLVRPGQVVGIVEAMKLMNEIAADRSGRVVEILVADGQPVEYDQPLVALDPA